MWLNDTCPHNIPSTTYRRSNGLVASHTCLRCGFYKDISPDWVIDEQIFQWYDIELEWNDHYVHGIDDGYCWVTDGIARAYGKDWRTNEEQRNRIGIPASEDIEQLEPPSIREYRLSQEERINTHAEVVLRSHFYDDRYGYSLAWTLLFGSHGVLGTLLQSRRNA